MSRYSRAWLSLREEADAAARAVDLVEPLRARLAGQPRLVICDLGCGTGSMGRWLAARLPGRQHWILVDHDVGLLNQASAALPRTSADNAPVTAAVRQLDLGTLTVRDVVGSALVTASAVLDLLTRADVERLAEACVQAECPALLTLTVTGQVSFHPANPMDLPLAAAFNAHQRRGGTLGPDAVAATAAAFTRLGAHVTTRPSPWRLGSHRPALTRQWLRGWVDAACEQQPELAGEATDYLQRRLAEVDAGQLRVRVDHRDLLAG